MVNVDTLYMTILRYNDRAKY